MAKYGVIPYSPGAADRYDDRGADRISDLILRAGDIAAQNKMQQGDIWGGTVAGLGQLAGGAIQDYQAQKAAQAKAQQEQEQKRALGGLVGKAQDPELELQDFLADVPPELQPQALDTFTKVRTSQAEATKRRQEADEHETYAAAAAANILEQALDTPLEGFARKKLFSLFPPDQVAQFQDLPSDQLRPVLQKFQTGSQKFQKEALEAEKTKAETAAKLAEPGYKEREFGLKERELAGKQQEATAERAAEQARLGLGYAQLAETRRGHDLTAGGSAGGDENASFLLQGGTADKVPIKARTAAVEAARASGGLDGTGFVPTSQAQLNKYSDLMDLRSRGKRLEKLLDDPEVQAKLGPVAGRFTAGTKEWMGASAKVKEAFDLLENFSDTELRKRSGAAISPGEYDRITGFTVSGVKQPDSNLTNLRSMLKEIDSGLKRQGVQRFQDETSAPTERPAVITDPNWGQK